ncbi:spectrin alpha chain, non-erythrocytic 1 isoform X1 [Pelobates cultripes]|uniref:Spectrin alpha chain, non-erythrocytic 1 isoform X1 n=1 Tax=Pelobates cultripes TaxID=61616 RepID=A0AAD1WPP6_PELCU|nr:spectrin alpha chain, non-erythrocytic 1 isoform X1 [Pelobates cultripes]
MDGYLGTPRDMRAHQAAAKMAPPSPDASSSDSPATGPAREESLTQIAADLATISANMMSKADKTDLLAEIRAVIREEVMECLLRLEAAIFCTIQAIFILQTFPSVSGKTRLFPCRSRPSREPLATSSVEDLESWSSEVGALSPPLELKMDSSGVKVLETAEDIQERRQQVLDRYLRFKELSTLRRQKLEDSYRFQFFQRDADELEKWIQEKLQIASDENYKDPTNLQGKLQKHQAFEAEVQANAGAIVKLDETGNLMISEGHFSSETIRTRLVELHRLWELLLLKMREKGIKLQQAQKLVQYLRECEDVMDWINDKEAIVTSEELGQDLEHVEVLQKKFEEFQTDLAAHEERVNEVNQFASKLTQEEHPELELIKTKQDEVNTAWQRLKGLALQRQGKLFGAAEVQRFNRDVDETIGWIREKEQLMASDDFGRDLASVQALLRKHEGLERDLAALEEKVKALCTESDRLQQSHPLNAVQIQAKGEELIANWDQIRTIAAERHTRLNDSYKLQRFLADFRDLTSWVTEMKALINADELANDVAGAEALLDRHQEHKGEIDAHEDSFKSADEAGNALLNAGHYASDEVREKLTILSEERTALLELWELRRQQYEQCMDLQLFYRDTEQVDNWMSKQERERYREKGGGASDVTRRATKAHGFPLPRQRGAALTERCERGAPRISAMMEFSDDVQAGVSVESVWRKSQELRCDSKSCQTIPIATKEAAHQVSVVSEACTQTEGGDNQRVLDVDLGPLLDYPDLGEFLQRVEGIMIKELKKNWRSHAFDGYEVNWEDQNQLVSCLHILQYPIALERLLQVTSVTWNCTGSVIACSYGRLGDGDWSTEKAYVCTWNLDRRGLKPNNPDVILEVPSSVMCLAFHPSQPSLIAGGLFNGEVLLWDTSRTDDPLIGRTGLTADTHTDAVYQVVWIKDKPQGNKLQIMSISSDGKILVWQMEKEGRIVLLDGFALVAQQIPNNIKINKHGRGDSAVGVTCLSFSHFDQSLFIVGVEGGYLLKCFSGTQTAALASTSSSVPLKAPAQFTFCPQGGPVHCLDCSPFHRNLFVSAGTDGHAHLYSMLQAKPLMSLHLSDKYLFSIRWSPVRPLVFAAASGEGELLLFDLAKSSQKPSLCIKQTDNGRPIYCLEFNRSQKKLLAAGDANGFIKIWQLSSDFTEQGARELVILDGIASEITD